MGLPISQPVPGTHKQMAKLNELFKPSKVCSRKLWFHIRPLWLIAPHLLKVGLSPTKLLIGKKIHTRVPTLPTLLDPSWPYLEQFREKDASLKARQKENFDKDHFAKILPDIPPGERVWLPDQKDEGTVLDKAGTPRSYTVETPSGELQRNRRHLNLLPGTPKQIQNQTAQTLAQPLLFLRRSTPSAPSCDRCVDQNHPLWPGNKTA